MPSRIAVWATSGVAFDGKLHDWLADCCGPSRRHLARPLKSGLASHPAIEPVQGQEVLPK